MKFRFSEQRGNVDRGWLKAKHSFSFGSYRDDQWDEFALLRVLNEDRIAAGSGFPMHPHDNMEIITIMLQGEMRHKDSMGNEASLKAGEVQAMTAGSGVLHSEWNGGDEEVHLFQMWIQTAESNLEPSYDQFTPAPGKVQVLASGYGHGLKINTAAEVIRQYLGKDESLVVFKSTNTYLQLVKGELELGGVHLKSGDAVAFEQEAEELTSLGESEVIIVNMKVGD